LKPASAKVGDPLLTWRFGRHTPTMVGVAVGVSAASTAVRSIW